MHNVRIAFHIHKLSYLDCAWLANSPYVITPQVDEHDMLSAFLLIVLELLFKSQVLGGIFAPAPGAGNRVGGYHAILNAHQKLRGGSGNKIGRASCRERE